ncbi:hypothetical protein OYT13_00900 [Pandoraea sp. XJJ-1]|uniref:hypothetical protein n=1 Tax=unclassified Pandoraea TaxID=2624094 RepID=UPI00034542F7|nr:MULTISPECIES: hypothetical protein [unclassified Pandoraea]WAL83080.1 hypothetical protein OYT13_00900 [Pandoraea sp. XJJ-1]BDD91743.1 hypothetical protein PanNE5_11830 [Pandoraea sp. NE5]
MSTKLRLTAGFAMTAMLSLPMAITPVRAAETIDTFARAHLKSSQEATAAQSAAAGGEPQPVTGATPDVAPELLFIHGVDDTTVAYLRVDGRFGYSVSDGDRFGDWRVVKIGSDYVDVARGGKPRRLLLPNAMGATQAGSARQGSPGRRNGDDF